MLTLIPKNKWKISTDRMDFGPKSKQEAEKQFKATIFSLPMLMLIPKKHPWEDPPISEGTMGIVVAHYNATTDVTKKVPPTLLFEGSSLGKDYSIELGLRGISNRRFETARRMSKGRYWIYQFVGWFQPLEGGLWMGSPSWAPDSYIYGVLENNIKGDIIYKLRGVAKYDNKDKFHSRIFSLSFDKVEEGDAAEINQILADAQQ